MNLRKVNRHVDFPLILDLAPFCSASCKVLRINNVCEILIVLTNLNVFMLCLTCLLSNGRFQNHIDLSLSLKVSLFSDILGWQCFCISVPLLSFPFYLTFMSICVRTWRPVNVSSTVSMGLLSTAAQCAEVTTLHM